MPGPPDVVVFDLIQTLADLEPLRRRFEAVGAPGHLLETWFASTLRDGFALTAAGGYADFQPVAVAALRAVLADVPALREPSSEAAEHVIAGMAELDLHPDVAAGMARLHDTGVRMVTLSNGSAQMAEALLRRGGVADLVEQTLSVSEVRRWKPAREPYLFAAERCGVTAERMALVAVHPWDIDGAKRADLLAGWLRRTAQPYPGFFERPDATGSDLGALVEGLLALAA